MLGRGELYQVFIDLAQHMLKTPPTAVTEHGKFKYANMTEICDVVFPQALLFCSYIAQKGCVVVAAPTFLSIPNTYNSVVMLHIEIHKKKIF